MKIVTLVLIGMLFQSMVSFGKYNISAPTFEELGVASSTSQSRISYQAYQDRLLKYSQDILEENNNKIAILKNTTTPNFKNSFSKYFVEAMNRKFSDYKVIYELSLENSLKLQDIVRDIVVDSVVRASKSWRKDYTDLIKASIEEQVSKYREKLIQLKGNTNTATQQNKLEKENDDRVSYLTSIIIHIDQLYRNSVDKKNIAFIEVLNIKSYLY